MKEIAVIHIGDRNADESVSLVGQEVCAHLRGTGGDAERARALIAEFDGRWTASPSTVSRPCSSWAASSAPTTSAAPCPRWPRSRRSSTAAAFAAGWNAGP